jgi:hypothetical protein
VRDRDGSPFEPVLKVVPLRLTFDSRSLPKVSGESANERDFLFDLAHTEVVDALVAWGDATLAESMAQARLVKGTIDVVEIQGGERCREVALPQASSFDKVAHAPASAPS